MHGQPWFPPPPPPRKPPGLSPLTIVLLVIGGVMVLGGGACVVLGALVYVGARAERDETADANAPNAQSTSTTPPALTGSSPPTATATPNGTALAPMGEDNDPSPAATQASTPKAAASGASAGGGGSWWCTASASVRVCGFANACNYQMVFGNGGGKDRFLASQQAKMACESMARAKGASAVCIVQCSAR